MFPNSYMHQDLARLRQAEFVAQARHTEQIRRARAGQLQPELRAGRRHERFTRFATRFATRMQGKPAPT
jgi:hypothetical protein